MKKIVEDIRKIFDSKIAFRMLCGVGIVIVILLIFSAGIVVGFHKASFGRAWGEHYNENFGMGHDPNAKLMGMMPVHLGLGEDYFPNAHGATGKIIKIELPNLIVQDQDNIEKTISTSNDTSIQEGRGNITATDLKVDDFIVTIGSPDDKGIIEAKFIRVMPFGMPVPPPMQQP